MSEDTSDDIERSVSVTGYQIDLARGSSVFVGHADDGVTVLEFVNNKGTVTKLGLSKEATAALTQLLTDKQGDLPVIYGMLIKYCAQGIAAGTAETSEAWAPCEAQEPDPEGDAP